jgi:sulfide:quinone oxidoreductase
LDALGNWVAVTLIDKNHSFVFGYAKLDVMFGKQEPTAVRLPYRTIAKPGAEFRQEAMLSIQASGRLLSGGSGSSVDTTLPSRRIGRSQTKTRHDMLDI